MIIVEEEHIIKHTEIYRMISLVINVMLVISLQIIKIRVKLFFKGVISFSGVSTFLYFNF